MSKTAWTNLRFVAMIATSTAVMYGFTCVTSFEIHHVPFSETRLYMPLLMGAALAVVMLTFMLGMDKSRSVNVTTYLASVVRRAMIPHQSIAILTSERAQIEDPRVRDLADRIIAAQRAEIEKIRGASRIWKESRGAADGVQASAARPARAETTCPVAVHPAVMPP